MQLVWSLLYLVHATFNPTQYNYHVYYACVLIVLGKASIIGIFQMKAVEHVLMEDVDMCAQRTVPQSTDTLAPVGMDTLFSRMATHV